MEMLNTDHKLDSQYHHIFEDAPIPLLELDLAEPIEYLIDNLEIKSAPSELNRMNNRYILTMLVIMDKMMGLFHLKGELMRGR